MPKEIKRNPRLVVSINPGRRKQLIDTCDENDLSDLAERLAAISGVLDIVAYDNPDANDAQTICVGLSAAANVCAENVKRIRFRNFGDKPNAASAR